MGVAVMAVIRAWLVRRALDVLERDLGRRWTVEALASELGVSRATLGRSFAAHRTRSPMRALAELRLERASALLRDGEDKVCVVAISVGYESEFAFSRAFKRAFGVAPAHYRQQLRALRATLAA